jgi:hypothetical protein
MSDTPRTNNYIENFPGSRREPRLLDFARQLERENAELRKQLSDIEEREAACCPEDVPFDNLITVLRQHITRLERRNAELRNLLRIADDLIDEYAEVVEHCDNVDEAREMIKDALAAKEVK